MGELVVLPKFQTAALETLLSFALGIAIESVLRLIASPILLPIEWLTLGPLPRDGAALARVLMAHLNNKRDVVLEQLRQNAMPEPAARGTDA